jgi:hypothetical protein
MNYQELTYITGNGRALFRTACALCFIKPFFVTKSTVSTGTSARSRKPSLKPCSFSQSQSGVTSLDNDFGSLPGPETAVLGC